MKDIVFSDCFEYRIIKIFHKGAFLRRWHTFRIYNLQYLHCFQRDCLHFPSSTSARKPVRRLFGLDWKQTAAVTEDKPNEQGKLLVFPCCSKAFVVSPHHAGSPALCLAHFSYNRTQRCVHCAVLALILPVRRCRMYERALLMLSAVS